MKNNFLLCSAFLALLASSCAHSDESTYNYVQIEESDTEEQIVWKAAHVVPTQRQFEWQKLELTAFAHFGLNTFADRQWGDGKDNPELFNPTDFDAEQWVSVLEETGFRSLILTCKHHDGFCLWPSAYTEYDVSLSSWKDGKGDVVREVADACHRHGLCFGVYLSPWDRHEETYGTPEYNDYFVNQLTELLTQYGQVDEVWLDGACGEGPNGKKQVYDYDRWYRLVRELQPQAVIAIVGPDVRWVGNEKGFGRNTEWSVLPNSNLDQKLIASNSQHELIVPPIPDNRSEDLGSRSVIRNAKALCWYPAEVDVSIRRSWFYSESNDGSTKSPERLMEIYFSSVGRNCSLLLNIPPNKQGLFGDDEVESLRAFARMRDEMFAHNLLEDAKIQASGYSVRKSRKLCDADYDTGLLLKEGLRTISFQWDSTRTFSVLMLQEDIRHGQRVEAFTLEYKDENGVWQEACSGTTVGYKRLMRFTPVSTSEARLVIKEVRHYPMIAEIGLF